MADISTVITGCELPFAYKGKVMNAYCWLKIVWIFLTAAAILASGWFQQEARGEGTFPHTSWEHREPPELGLNKANLEQLASSLGGRGCVIKDGYVVITWGDQAEKGDWLSSKTCIEHSAVLCHPRRFSKRC